MAKSSDQEKVNLVKRSHYTDSADFIRMAAGDRSCERTNCHCCRGIKISRADASQIRQVISFVLGVNDAQVSEILAAAYHQYGYSLERLRNVMVHTGPPQGKSMADDLAPRKGEKDGFCKNQRNIS